MDFIRQQLAQIQERLAGLTPSQKMLTGALVVIMVMTLLYWSKLATDRDTVALFPGPLKADELSKVEAALTARGIQFTADAGVVRVATEKQAEAMTAVAFNGAMPTNAQDAFEAMLKEVSPLDSRGVFSMRVKIAREAKFAQMLRMGDPNIVHVDFTIEEGEQGGLARPAPHANVSINTNGQAKVQKLAAAAYALASNAMPGMQRENVSVMIDGTLMGNGSLDGHAMAGDTLLEIKQRAQADAEDRIRRLYNEIRGLRVMVTADVDSQTKVEKSLKFDPNGKVSLPSETITEKSTSTEPAGSGEPGVMPNVGIDPRQGNTPLAGSNTERSEERMENHVGQTELQVNTPAGKPRITAASIRVPRSHFEASLKAKKRADPTEAELDTYIAAETDKMATEVKNNFRDSVADAAVTVVEYIDIDRMNLGDGVMVASAGGAGSSFTLLATNHAKEVALGALALTSLFMVGRMVKKSAPPIPEPALATSSNGAPVPLTLDGMPNIGGTVPLVSAVGSVLGNKKRGKGGNALDGSFDIAGDVMEGGPVMMGRELDDEVLETSQMVEQVGEFVKINPDTAAQLLKRWMNR